MKLHFTASRDLLLLFLLTNAVNAHLTLFKNEVLYWTNKKSVDDSFSGSTIEEGGDRPDSTDDITQSSGH